MESPPPSKTTSYALIGLIVAIFASLIFIPTIIAILPVERAKWYLAAAQNSYESAKKKDDPAFQEARRLLDRAVALDPAIQQSPDFLRLLNTIGYTPEDLMALVEKLNPADRELVCLELSDTWFTQARYGEILNFIDKIYPPEKSETRSPQIHNQYAYAAALADEKLPEGLAAIEQALKQQENASYLDTKAWLLHKLNRDDDALLTIQAAVRSMYVDLENSFQQAPTTIFDTSVESMLAFCRAVQQRDILSSINTEDLVARLEETQDFDAFNRVERRVEETLKPKASQKKAGPPKSPKQPDDAASQINATAEPSADEEIAEVASDAAIESLNANESIALAKDQAVDATDATDATVQTPDLFAKMLDGLKPVAAPQNYQAASAAILRQIATFRYHRAEILKDAGFDHVAYLEFAFLKANGFKDLSQLK